MRKEYFLIIVIILIVLISLFLFLYSFPKKESPKIDIKICESLKNKDFNDICRNIFQEDLEACKKYPNLSMLCYETVLMKMKDNLKHNFCISLSDDYAKYTCLLDLAIRDLNKKLCAETYENTCMYEIALKKKDTNICNQINDDILKFRCLALLKNDLSYCNEILDEPEKNICMALFSSHSSICQNDRDCLFNMAITTKNSNICNLIDSELEKFICLVKISNKIETCDGAIISHVRERCRLEYIKVNLS